MTPPDTDTPAVVLKEDAGSITAQSASIPGAAAAEAIASRLTPDEQSQLLYAECRAVDNGGLLNLEQMNMADRSAMGAFERNGLLMWDYLDGLRDRCGAWVILTDLGWDVAHVCRRNRAARSPNPAVVRAHALGIEARAAIAKAMEASQ